MARVAEKASTRETVTAAAEWLGSDSHAIRFGYENVAV
jgi:hypothetical protein